MNVLDTGEESPTIVMLLDNEHGVDVAARLLDWSTRGLLRPFVLVNGEGELHPDSPLIGLSGNKTSDPQTVLAAHGVQRFNIVSLSGPDGPTAPASALIARLLAAAVDYSSATQVWLYGVSVDDPRPIGNMSSDPRAHHLVLSPEDRFDDQSIAAGNQAAAIHERLAFVGAVVGGLFVTQSWAPANRLPPTSTAQFRLARAFGRVALGSSEVLGELREAIDSLRLDPVAMAALVGGVPATDPVSLVSMCAQEFVSKAADGELLYRPYKRVAPKGPTRITLRVALKMLWRFMVDSLRGDLFSLVDDAALAIRNSVERRAERMIFGEGSVFTLTADGVGAVRSTSSNATDLAEQLVRGGDMSVQISASPLLWQQLRDTVFALSDGSNPPSFMTLPVLNSRPMTVTSPTLLAPLAAEGIPELTRVSLGGITIPQVDRACDPTAADRRGAELDIALTLAQKPAADVDGIVEPAADGDRVGLLVKEFEIWLGARRSSFTWIVARHAGEQLERSSAQMQHSANALKQRLSKNAPPAVDDPRSADQRAAEKRAKVAVKVLCVCAMVGLIAAPALAFIRGALNLLPWLLVQTVFVSGVLIWLAFIYMATLRRRFQAAHRYNTESHEFEQDVLSAMHSAAQLLRLRSANLQLVEWSDVIAEVISHPFGSGDEDAVGAKPEFVVNGPLCLVQGYGSMPVPTINRLAYLVGKSIYGRGWLSDVFSARAQAVGIATRRQTAGDVDELSLDADFDVNAHLGLASSLRKALLADHSERLTVESQLIGLSAEPVDGLFDEVHLVARDLSVDVPSFFQACLPPRRGQKGAVFNNDLLGPIFDQSDDAIVVSDSFCLTPLFARQSRLTPRGDPADAQVSMEISPATWLDGRIAALAFRLDLGNPVPQSRFAKHASIPLVHKHAAPAPRPLI